MEQCNWVDVILCTTKAGDAAESEASHASDLVPAEADLMTFSEALKTSALGHTKRVNHAESRIVTQLQCWC